MRQDIFGDVQVAIKALRNAGVFNVPFFGRPPFIIPTGCYIRPSGYTLAPTNITLTLTAARYYSVAIVIDQPTTFAGAWCANTGAGDNGKNLKMAIWAESSSGGPGALAKSFGAVALNGSATTRSFASSWSAPAGRYFLELVSDSTPILATMVSVTRQTDVGQFITPPDVAPLGFIGSPSLGGTTYYDNIPIGAYVAGTYANFPESTALALTTTIVNGNGGVLPAMGLYT